VGVFEKQGFKHGAWRDVGYWTRVIEGDDPPAPIRSVREALDQPKAPGAVP
jgi:hypothetical protein